MIIKIKDLEVTFSAEDLNAMSKDFRVWMLNRIRQEVESAGQTQPEAQKAKRRGRPPKKEANNG